MKKAKQDQHLIKMNDEHQMLCQMLRDWGKASLEPQAQAWDEEQEIPASTLREAEDLGLLSISLPEERGGAGMGYLASIHAIETVARFEGALALKVALFNGPIATCWPEEIEEIDAAWGAGCGVIQVAEDGARGLLSDVPWATGAKWLMVPQGNRLYLVDLHSTGVKLTPHQDRLSLRCAEWCDIFLDGAKTLAFPLERSVRTLAEAWVNLGWAALAIGLGTSGSKLGINYAQERFQFGKPISSFQAIQWMIADNVAELDAARLLAYQAGRQLESGAIVQGARLAAEARLLAADAGHQACDRGIQMHGGYGYTREYQVERFWRDVQRCYPVGGKGRLHQQIVAGLT